VDWFSLVGRNWRNFANSRMSNCVEAAFGNAVLQWSTFNGHPVVVSDADVERLYARLSGYSPADPSNDPGTNMRAAIEAWTQDGWDIGTRLRNTANGFATLQPSNIAHIKHATHLYGGVIAGFTFPRAYSRRLHWEIDPLVDPALNASHAVYVVGYDQDTLTFITHGKRATMTWTFFVKYSDEAYAVLNPLWLQAGAAPNGKSGDFLRTALPLLESKPSLSVSNTIVISAS